MIVRCPACSTSYRHDPAVVAAVSLAECSRCDERFPLRPARRSYVIVEANGVAASVRPAARAVDLPPRGLERPSILGLETTERGESQQMGESQAPATPSRSALSEFLIAIVPPCIGASLAYHLAQRGQLDPVAWSALGGALGFLLGWGCLLWIRRND